MPSYTTEMEKGHFGDGDGDGVDRRTENTNEFPLDFGGVLPTTDGALHHQIYEFFQPGPVAQQSLQLDSSTFQESAFPFPPNYPPNLYHLPDHVPTATAAEIRASNSGPLHPRSPSSEFADYLGSHVQRSPWRKPAATGESGEPESHGFLITSSNVDDHRASNQLRFQTSCAQAKPSYSGHATPDESPPNVGLQAFSRGTFLGYDTSFAGLKSRGCEIARSLPRHRVGMNSQKVMAVPDHRNFLNAKRPSDQVEHILRERLRRDDMTSKFRTLESLIPPGPKRDRATIVEDSIQYVKNLHHRLKVLQEKRSGMKASSNTVTVKPRTTAKRHTVTVHPVTVKKSKPGMDDDIKNAALVDSGAIVLPESDSPSESNDENIAVAKGSSIDNVEVHLDLPHRIVIEMTCQSHGRIQSQILEALERLRLEVVQCSISKLHGRAMCVVAVKVMADSPITSDAIVRGLKRDVREPVTPKSSPAH